VDIAIIAPTSMLGWTAAKSQYHLALPHLLEVPEYEDFYRQTPGYKILDNGVAEGVQTEASMLLSWAQRISAHEIVVPDAMRDFRTTVEKVREFRNIAKFASEFKYAAVVQGKNPHEWATCVQFYVEEDWIDVIMFPRCMNLEHKEARAQMIVSLAHRDLLGGKQIHCLGASKWVDEVKVLSHIAHHDGSYVIRGMDTSLPVVLGISGVDINSKQYLHRPATYFEWEVIRDSRVGQLVEHNVDTFLRWGTGHPSAS
jgi:hypothetical protein